MTLSYTTRDLQARCAALGHSPGQIDGARGPKTRAAVKAAMEDRGVTSEAGLFHESGLHRVHWHWTAGGHLKSHLELAKKHYNDVVDHEGNIHDGAWRAEAQARYSVPNRIGVSHTLNANTGTIGISAMGMMKATHTPFNPGPSPITMASIEGMLFRTAEYCEMFDIPVSMWSTLSHSEVQPNLGIRQNHKWDIDWLPGMDKPDTPKKVNDRLRDMLKERMQVDPLERLKMFEDVCNMTKTK